MDLLTASVRVLIVDDQESFRSAARLVVELADGFEVAGEAQTGEEGVRLVDEIEPNLVLMDINLPGIDGLEATRRIALTHPGVRIVVLSTYDASDYETRALAAGAVAFLSKSDFDPGSLAAAWSTG